MTTPKPFNHGTTWLITERTAPAWAAVLNLLNDGQWHHRADIYQAMRETANLADQTINNHLKSASRRGWITTRDDLVKVRNTDLIRHHLGAVQ